MIFEHGITSHLKIYKILYLKPHHYIKLYFKNRLVERFIIRWKDQPSLYNILLLSTDMENLGGLGQQAPIFSNTEDGRSKYP